MFALADGGDAAAALPGCCKHRRCWVDGRQNHKQARACVRENFVFTASVSNEAPPVQSCPSELVQLGPLPLGGSKTPSGQLLERRKKPPPPANAMPSAGERPFLLTFYGRLDKK